jgi:iron complex transport system ATP-binding protein
MDIVVDALSAGYGGTPVFAGVDLRLRAGEVVAIVGANGCGKSTLLRCLARLHEPLAGCIAIDGENLDSLSARSLALKLGFLPQFPQAPAGLKLSALVAFGRHPHRGWLAPWSRADEDAVRDALARTNLADFADKPVDTLSGGQRQRAWLALVLAQQTPILMLDEPTSMLDPGHQQELLSLIRELGDAGRSIVMVLHDLSSAGRYADRLVALAEGRVVADGAPREVLTTTLVRRLYGIDSHILRAPDDGAPVVVPARIDSTLHSSLHSSRKIA